MIVADRQSAPDIVRRRIAVRGQVQGVGFRPYVYRVAADLGLRGWVCNSGEGVAIEVQGSATAVQAFITRLRGEAPPLARITAIEQTAVPVVTAPSPFFIATSRADAAHTIVVPDAAVCPACLAELFNPNDRRYRYPFIACTCCGPRFTITRALPFDRVNTSMAAYAECPACRREYQDPADRRFHAQANACPACGPALSLRDADGIEVAEADVIAAALTAIRGGHIVALKGLGGFHLLCDARNAEAVARLRARKGREAKPFAVMAANVASISPWTRCGAEERQLLESPARPIVLLKKDVDCDHALAGIAPGVGHVGVMLPYTPLHYLLFHDAAGRPAGAAWRQAPQPLLLVCTSANVGGEPLVITNEEACMRLWGIANFFVTHDRDIDQRCDDSVMTVMNRAPMFIRRARGYVPQAIKLPRSGPTVLAFGGDLKNTLCLTRGDEAHISQHNGDLDNAATCRAMDAAVDRLLAMLNAEPVGVVHDSHPEFYSSRLARRFAAERNISCLAVQHHHAHIAAVMAEHGLNGPVLGVALDGLGWGDDGGLWGGELLRVAGADSKRLGHLSPLALPGGDRAAREPWRMAASALHALGRGHEIKRRFAYPAAETVMQLLDRKLNAPLTSSAGRWFDAAAGLLGIAERTSYEGQAAMRLEAMAIRRGPVVPDSLGYRLEQDGILNLLPLLDRLALEQNAEYGAALFHATLVAAVRGWIQNAAAQEGVRDVVLSGGCFMNGILSKDLCDVLHSSGLNVYMARQVPPNDGGLSLGQAWVGMQRFSAMSLD